MTRHAQVTWHTGPDPRASMLLAGCGVLATLLVGFFFSPTAGALTIAATLFAAGIWRGLAPRATRAAGIAVRSKWVDVFTYLALATAITTLAFIAPDLG